MKQRQLGRTGLKVSELCLGSMTWGSQTGSDEAHDQIDRALDAGVNFIDTAEIYPVNPIKARTIGRTERIVGLWLEGRMRRNDLVIATKHSGKGMPQIRDGASICPKTIPVAIEGSLRRLKTDTIDLYQFHWPNRGGYMFRKNWTYDASGFSRKCIIQDMEDCLGALQQEVKRGTIRAFGVSNESAWGITRWLDAADRTGGPRAASVQNEYSMLYRLFDTDLSEMSVLEEVGLLAFSPLAAGFLTGKYQNGQIPDGSRMTLNKDMGGRKTKRVFSAVDAYLDVAKKHELDPVQMAIAWTLTRPFVTASIIGATTTDQLKVSLGAADLKLDPAVLEDIDNVHKAHPMPY